MFNAVTILWLSTLSEADSGGGGGGGSELVTLGGPLYVCNIIYYRRLGAIVGQPEPPTMP